MKSLSSSYYTDPSIFLLEKEHIFEKSWIPIAHSSELPEGSGALERTLLGNSFVIVREGKTLRAFRNICPHRAGPLVWPEECTALKALRCRYHGWRFDLKGKRTHSPDFGRKVTGHDLTPIALATHQDIIFICLQEPPPKLLLRELLQIHAPDLTLFRYHSQARHKINCNWKTYIENYLEGYHIPYLHPSLRASITQSQYKVHLHEDLIIHEVPSDPKSPAAGFWAYLWPNTAINVYGKGMSIERILPLDTHNTQIHYLYLFARDITQQECERAIEMSRQVTEEDIRICNVLAKNLRSGTYMGGPLSEKHEKGVAYVQQRILKAIT